ncbi:MAG: hypothetical protein DRR16_27160 [Candidatus Parabeggiatoa sp. nov. 3]|nr:MAG: hypothetical protein DRR00_13135 [Gammaproteobacteria bacterium]RKZ65512.1 MAG: hypothetical protein DRQ99_12400 [Gammaproteobacteria bacterium]RKZ78701.1 MAG: hypothetical protein DRR16_27160 [Gammaproteobacteria bacterium]HEW98310.1 hypothetical protein [Beggiatoa sp.]
MLTTLARFGVSERELNFFKRSIPIADDKAVQIVQRGVPNARALSHFLGELVLRLLEQYVQEATQVQVIRVIDDIGLLTSSAVEAVTAWQAVQTFCDAFGLSVNEEKCGAVCIGGGDCPASLPTGLPQWLLLQLDHNGDWRVNQTAFQAHLEQSVEYVSKSHAIISRVTLYNGNLAYLIKGLGIKLPLGNVHRESINQAIAQFHYAFLGETQGIVALIRQLIQERFFEKDQAVSIPDAWLYWPISAGGLGLKQAMILVTRYNQAYKQQPPLPEFPQGEKGLKQGINPPARNEGSQDWQSRKNKWATFYARLQTEIEPVKPIATPVMETLVNDFIERGSKLTSGRQQNITVYWRWILYTYGPQILDYFGSFRFLMTELVPLQLISQGRLKSPFFDESISRYPQGSNVGYAQSPYPSPSIPQPAHFDFDKELTDEVPF